MLYGLGMLAMVLGVVFKLFPPKNVNYFYGHKTKLSMTNQNTWEEAQRFGGISMIVTGAVIVALAYICYGILGLNDGANRIVIVLVVVASMICMVAANEVHLRRIFDQNGKRKSSV